MIVDLLTIRADRDVYYYGCVPRQSGVSQALQAPEMTGAVVTGGCLTSHSFAFCCPAGGLYIYTYTCIVVSYCNFTI